MERLFTDKEYSDKAIQATNEGKQLYILQHDIEYEIDVQDTHIVKRIVTRQKVDDDGEPLYHKDGSPVMETVEIEVEEPIYDEEGKPVTHKETRTKTVQELVIACCGYYVCMYDNVTDGTINPNIAAERKAKFLKTFFKIPNATNNDIDGYYRKKPKGYASAVESIDTTFNIVNILKKLPANTLTFYQEPDFTKEEQCTEEWLVEHQFKNEEMTATEFAQFYTRFITAWNEQEHED